MKEILLYLTKTKKNTLRFSSLDSIKKMETPVEYDDTKNLKRVENIVERWEIQKVEKDGLDDDFRQKLKIDFKLLLRKLK